MASEQCMNLWAVEPEMILAGVALALVPVAGFARGRWRAIPTLAALVGLIAALAVTAHLWTTPPVAAFCNTWAVDRFATFYQLLLEFAALITVLMLASHFDDRPQMAHAPVLVLFATVGGMGLVASLDLGLIILFLQMVSLPSYLLVGLQRSEPRAQEATLKYFLYGAAALSIMAYGLTFLYGLTGDLSLRDIGSELRSADPVWIAVAFGLVLVGYAFEATLVPFHFWAPDAYEGANAPAAGFISVVPKIAAFGGLLRLLIEALPGSQAHWPWVIAILAAITMTLGNLAALRQKRLKRLLAYSSTAQAGYVSIAVAAALRSQSAIAAVGYYLAAYLLMNLGAFLVAAQLERALGTDDLYALRGLGRSSPWPATAMTVCLLSLAGIPPLAGFAGKVLLLSAALDAGLVWLAVLAAVNMAIGLFYYARVAASIYFETPAHDGCLAAGLGYAGGLALSVAGTLIAGILPNVVVPASIAARLLR